MQYSYRKLKYAQSLFFMNIRRRRGIVFMYYVDWLLLWSMWRFLLVISFSYYDYIRIAGDLDDLGSLFSFSGDNNNSIIVSRVASTATAATSSFFSSKQPHLFIYDC